MKKRVVILGGKESGTGAALLAQKLECETFVSDSGDIPKEYKKILIANNIEFEERTHSFEKILNADEVIVSPGIPNSAPIIIELEKLQIPVISEIEFASRYITGKTIAISGSNGKTTTTLLTHHIFKSDGQNVALAGNIGHSFALQLAKNFNNQPDWWILELSSFQLDRCYNFSPDISILTNITPDHLDRYDYSMQNYIDSKFRIVQNHTNSNYLIYCSDDPVLQTEIKNKKINSNKLAFSLKHENQSIAYIKNDEIIITYPNNFKMKKSELWQNGTHNIYNSMAAAAAANVAKIKKDNIRSSLQTFVNAPHRLQFVRDIDGIQFINDSKATNVNSTHYALDSMKSKTIWIVGGIDKGNDYSEIAPLVKEKVTSIVCLGKDNKRIIDSFKDICPNIIETKSMEDAVKSAFYLANKGETVLLSPACASFDLFKNYMDRGDQFIENVNQLKS